MLVLIALGEIGLLRRGDDPAPRVSPVSLLTDSGVILGLFLGRRPAPTTSLQPVCAPPLEIVTLS